MKPPELTLQPLIDAQQDVLNQIRTLLGLTEYGPSVVDAVRKLVEAQAPATSGYIEMVGTAQPKLDWSENPQVSNLTDPIETALTALDSAQNGLRWYQEQHPSDDSSADTETHEQIEEACDKLNASLFMVNTRLKSFLDIAAGDGLSINGIEASDLYIGIFGNPE